MRKKNVTRCRIWHELKKQVKEALGEIPQHIPEGTKEEWIPGMENFKEYFWAFYIRDAVLERDEYTCQYCGADGSEWSYDEGHLEVHHIIPRSQGGSDHPGNLVTLCYKCHTKTFREAKNKVMFDDKQAKLEI